MSENRTKAPAGQRREELLLAAGRLFTEHGYHATAMQQLADAVGIHKGSFYYYWPSKEELLFEILTTRLSASQKRLDTVVAKKLKSTDTLQECIRVLMEDMCGDRMESLAIVSFTDANVLAPERREEYTDMRRKYEQIFNRVLSEGIDDGSFRSVDISLTVKHIIGMCGWSVLWYRPEGRLQPAEIADQIYETLIEGIHGIDIRKAADNAPHTQTSTGR